MHLVGFAGGIAGVVIALSLSLRAWEYTLQRFGGANSEALQIFGTLMVLLFAEQFLD